MRRESGTRRRNKRRAVVDSRGRGRVAGAWRPRRTEASAWLPLPVVVAGALGAVALGLVAEQLRGTPSDDPRAVAAPRASVEDAAAVAAALRPFEEHEAALTEFFADQGEEAAALRDAIERARRAVVRVRVENDIRRKNGVKMTTFTRGSGFVLAGGEWLVISAHQGRPGFTGHPERTCVNFVTPDGRGFVATLHDFEDGEDDWALCRIHNPFDMPLDGIEVGMLRDDGLVASLGYPRIGSEEVDTQVGRDPVSGEPLIARRRDASAIAAIGRRDASQYPPEAPLLVAPPQLNGMSGGPVIDRFGRVVGVTMGYRMDELQFVNTAAGVRVDSALSLQFTPCDRFRVPARHTTPSRRLIARILAVLHGRYDPQTTPEEFGLTQSEVRELFGPVDADDVEDSARDALKGAGAVRASVGVSLFQHKRWYRARLRQLADLGHPAAAEFRRSLDRAVTLDAEGVIGLLGLESLVEVCEETGLQVGLRTLEPLRTSTHESTRIAYVQYLSTIADDPREALRIVFSIADSGEVEALREAAHASVATLFERRPEIAIDLAHRDPPQATRSADADIRIDGVCVLGRKLDEASVALLESLEQSDPDPLVRAAARHFVDSGR